MTAPLADLPIIAITSGEPAGIGPDIILQALSERSFNARLLILGDEQLFRQRAASLNIDMAIKLVSSAQETPAHQQGSLCIMPVAMAKPAIAGQLDVANAPYVLETLRRACQGCLDKEFDALVTPPVHKGILCETGQHFSGHTEFFQQQCRSPHVVMMLASEAMKVAL